MHSLRETIVKNKESLFDVRQLLRQCKGDLTGEPYFRITKLKRKRVRNSTSTQGYI